MAKGMKKGQELVMMGSGVGTGRSLLREFRGEVSHTDNEPTRVVEMDLSKIEVRVLAHMREDAEKMDDTDEYRRPTDLSGFNTAKVRTLLSLKDAEKILRGEGCQTVRNPRKMAAELFDVDESDVTEAQRQFAKTFYFGELYGNPQTFVEFLKDRGLPKPIEES